MKLDELVDHFLVRDSESNIQMATSLMGALNEISVFTQ